MLQRFHLATISLVVLSGVLGFAAAEDSFRSLPVVGSLITHDEPAGGELKFRPGCTSCSSTVAADLSTSRGTGPRAQGQAMMSTATAFTTAALATPLSGE